MQENTSLKRSGIVAELNEELENCIPSVNDVSDDIEAKLLWESISKFLFTLPDEKQVMFMMNTLVFKLRMKQLLTAVLKQKINDDVPVL